MAERRASLASAFDLRSSALSFCLPVAASWASTVQSRQRLAKPGLSGRSSKSSPQTAQVLMGKVIRTV